MMVDVRVIKTEKDYEFLTPSQTLRKATSLSFW